MTTNLRFMGYVVAAATAHFLITLPLLGIAAAGAMGRIPDHGAGPMIIPPISAAEQAASTVLLVLLLPVQPLMNNLPADGHMSVAPLILNSLLWGAAIALLVRLVSRRVRR